MPLTVFCDESGFTGENLLNRDQPFFSYASVAIDPLDANELVKQITMDFRVQGNELKGSRLLRYAKGRKAITCIVDKLASRMQLVVHHKKYALATKFFEYAFEPLVSDINSLFYRVNFHKFIGNILYLSVLAGRERAIELCRRFEDAVRDDDTALRDMLSIHAADERDPVEQLISFGVYNRDAILRELAEVKRYGGWILELTSTSIWSLLAHWGDRTDCLEVFCDQSVPLRDAQEHINVMVGRTDKVMINFGGRKKSLIFNLARPLQLVDSATTPGIQIADVLAATACYALENREESWSRDVLDRLFANDAIHDDCVYPELDRIDLNTMEGSVNYVLLLELVERSSKGESLTTGISDFINVARERFPAFARNHLAHDLLADRID